MDNNKVIVTSGDVKGNITSCKIENQIKSIKIDHALSLSGDVTYITYDVCNRQVLAEYTRPEISELGWALVFTLCIMSFFGAIKFFLDSL